MSKMHILIDVGNSVTVRVPFPSTEVTILSLKQELTRRATKMRVGGDIVQSVERYHLKDPSGAHVFDGDTLLALGLLITEGTGGCWTIDGAAPIPVDPRRDGAVKRLTAVFAPIVSKHRALHGRQRQPRPLKGILLQELSKELNHKIRLFRLWPQSAIEALLMCDSDVLFQMGQGEVIFYPLERQVKYLYLLTGGEVTTYTSMQTFDTVLAPKKMIQPIKTYLPFQLLNEMECLTGVPHKELMRSSTTSPAMCVRIPLSHVQMVWGQFMTPTSSMYRHIHIDMLQHLYCESASPWKDILKDYPLSVDDVREGFRDELSQYPTAAAAWLLEQATPVFIPQGLSIVDLFGLRGEDNIDIDNNSGVSVFKTYGIWDWKRNVVKPEDIIRNEMCDVMIDSPVSLVFIIRHEVFHILKTLFVQVGHAHDNSAVNHSHTGPEVVSSEPCTSNDVKELSALGALLGAANTIPELSTSPLRLLGTGPNNGINNNANDSSLRSLDLLLGAASTIPELSTSPLRLLGTGPNNGINNNANDSSLRSLDLLLGAAST
eukprot:PhF_6_TR42802/c0_g1_i3/m.64794